MRALEAAVFDLLESPFMLHEGLPCSRFHGAASECFLGGGPVDFLSRAHPPTDIDQNGLLPTGFPIAITSARWASYSACIPISARGAPADSDSSVNWYARNFSVRHVSARQNRSLKHSSCLAPAEWWFFLALVAASPRGREPRCMFFSAQTSCRDRRKQRTHAGFDLRNYTGVGSRF